MWAIGLSVVGAAGCGDYRVLGGGGVLKGGCVTQGSLILPILLPKLP